MKACAVCQDVKPLSDFYAHKGMKDGYLGKCKECAKAAERARRKSKIEEIREYDRNRGNLPHRVEARKSYQKTQAYKDSHVSANKRYKELHPERAIARYAVNNAIRDGRIEAWPVCAVPECSCAPEAHHPDYSRPLDVVWLCDRHHKDAHNIARGISRQKQSNL